jgi:drug/metabolite transporter (DMT)-like permease
MTDPSVPCQTAQPTVSLARGTDAPAQRISRTGLQGLSRETAGLLWGLLGVVGFSLSLPATRAAVPDFGPVVVGLGRAVIAGALAAGLLLLLRETPPVRRHWPSLIVVALGVVVGFPIFSAIALRHVPSAHGAVVVGLLPAATAVMAVLRAGERPPLPFWLACAAGVGAVLVFAAVEGAGQPEPADLWLLLAVLAAALGYAEGGRLSRELGGWRVICWVLVFSAPVLLVPVGVVVARDGLSGSPGAWLGLIYVALVSMFLGFFAWYRGLALGGVARVGQVQLVQPVLTLVWSALLLGETIRPRTALAALLVVGCVALSRRAWAPVGARAAPTPAVVE